MRDFVDANGNPVSVDCDQVSAIIADEARPNERTKIRLKGGGETIVVAGSHEEVRKKLKKRKPGIRPGDLERAGLSPGLSGNPIVEAYE